MLLDSAANRKTITEYLDSLSEDDFIAEVVIPFFSNFGYHHFRTNIHGPGEHGKDVIFYRHLPFFMSDEFLVVQAKSEQVTASNVSGFASQLVRAFKTPFKGRTAKSEHYANSVAFVSSKGITNDAEFEIGSLADNNQNVRFLYQENIADLMLKNAIIPTSLESKLIKIETDVTDSREDKHVIQVILENNSEKIKNLFNHELLILSSRLGIKAREFITDYIFNTWTNDWSWDNTALHMEWLDKYFDLIPHTRYSNFATVISEFNSSTPSYQAFSCTTRVVQKLTPQHIVTFLNEFFASTYVHCNNKKTVALMYRKIKELKDSNELNSTQEKLCLKIIDYLILIKKAPLDKNQKAKYNKLRDSLSRKFNPELYE